MSSVREARARFEEKAKSDADAQARAKQASQHVRIDWSSMKQRYDGASAAAPTGTAAAAAAAAGATVAFPAKPTQAPPTRPATAAAATPTATTTNTTTTTTNNNNTTTPTPTPTTTVTVTTGAAAGVSADVLGEMRQRRSTYTNVLRQISENVHLTTEPPATTGTAPGSIKIHAIEAYHSDDDDDDDEELDLQGRKHDAPGAKRAESDDDDDGSDGSDDAKDDAKDDASSKSKAVIEPDEAYGQYDWATLEAELLGPDGTPTRTATPPAKGGKAPPAPQVGVRAASQLTVSDMLDDADDDDETEMLRIIQAELTAPGRGTLQGVDIMAALSALEAPDEQIEAESDDEDATAAAKRPASASAAARSSTAASDDESSDDDSGAGEHLGAPQAELEKLDAKTLVSLVQKERARATEAKKTIGSLIEQITEYQTAMEEEKAVLELRVKEAMVEIASLEQLQEKRESELSAFYEEKIDVLIAEVETEKRANTKLSNETIQNLQTLMVELQNIEAVNSRLNKELADERDQHVQALAQVDELQAKLDAKGGDKDESDESRARRHKSSRSAGGSKRHEPLTPRGQRSLPPSVPARDVQAALAKGDAKELGALCAQLRDENDALRATLQRGVVDEATERKLLQLGALVAEIQHGLGIAADELRATPPALPPADVSAAAAATPAPSAAPSAAPPATTTAAAGAAMATMPALNRDALKPSDADARRQSASVSTAGVSRMARPTGKSSGSGIAQASAGSAAAAPPSLPDESIVPQGELVNKMQQLIQTHEETLSLLAKSTGGAEPTGGTLRRNTLMSAGSDLRLSTRHSLMMDAPAARQSSLMESPSMLSRQSFLDGAGNASVMDVAKKVRLQRRRLGLALSLRDLPEPVCGLLDVDECVWAATSNGHIGMWDKSTHALTEVRNTGAPAVHQLVRASKATVWGVSGKDAFVYVWSIKNGKMGKKLSGHTSKVTALLVVGKHVWTTSTDMSIIVWNAKSFKQVKKIPVTTFLVSMHLHEGRVWMGTESAIMRWDPNTYRPVDVLRAHTKMVTCMVSASASVVWSSSADRTICAWDGTSGALLERFEAHESRVLGLTVAGDTVWSCAADKSIKCWDRTTHKQRRAVMGAHDDTVSCLLYVPDATKQTDGAVWSGSNDQTIGLWICHPKYDVLPAGAAGAAASAPPAADASSAAKAPAPASTAAAASVAPVGVLAKNATLPALPARDPAISAAVAAVGKPSTMRREDSVKISRPSVPAPVPSSQSTPVGGSRKMARGEHHAGDAGESLAASAVLPATAPAVSLSDESLSASDGATTRERTSTKGSSKSAGSQRRQNRPVTTVLDKADAGSKKESRKSAAKELDADDGVKLVEDATADAVLIGKADYGTRPAIIAHAVSMRGAADDGEFALISPTWDKPKLQFAKWYSKRAKEEANFKLGSYQLVLVQEEPKIYVANLLVCDEKGALNEAAFLQCVTNLALRAADLDAVIHMAKNDKWAPKEREQQFMALFFRIPRVRVWLHHAKEQ
jgi:hypothetical protein